MVFRLNRLKKMRKAKGLTQKELAKQVGLSAKMVSLYENGQGVPDADHLTRIADAIDTNVDYLLDRTSYSGRLTDLHYRVLEAFTEGDENRLIDLLRQHFIQKGLGKKPITRRKPPVK